MAIPKVFVSSTCYDLKYIRENLKYFISNIGYEPVLSDDGDVYYDVDSHTHDACLTEVSNCQLFVLIIGGRYGGKYRDSDKSITNMEYNEAVRQKIPVFTLVELDVYGQHHLYVKNRANNTINYTAVDNSKIFDFIDEVRKNAINNAIFPFRNFTEIEDYLKKQWAGMMYKFLTTESESKRVSELFEQIQSATKKIEQYTKIVVEKVVDADTKTILKAYIEMKDILRDEKCFIQDLMSSFGISANPEDILSYDSVFDYLSYKGLDYSSEKDVNGEQYWDIKNLDSFSRQAVHLLNWDIAAEYAKDRDKLLRNMNKNKLSIEQIKSIL